MDAETLAAIQRLDRLVTETHDAIATIQAVINQHSDTISQIFNRLGDLAGAHDNP